MESIDITTPLQAGEALPVLKHRETPAQIPARVAEEDPSIRRKKKKSREDGSQRDKSQRSNHDGDEESQEKAGTTSRKKKVKKRDKTAESSGVVGDLIGLSWSPEQRNEPTVTTLEEASASNKKKKKDKVGAASRSKSKGSSDSDTGNWYPLFSDNSKVEIHQSVQCIASDQVQITYRVKNISDLTISSVAISVDEQSAHAYRISGDNSRVIIAQNISPGSEQLRNVTYDIAPGVQRTQSNALLLKVHVLLESLIGPETATVNAAKILLTPFIFFEPHTMTQEGFIELCASSERSSVSKTKVKLSATSTNLKKQFRKLCHALHAYEIDYVEHKAMSACSKVFHQGGAGEFTIICALLKASSSGKSISVEIKCFGRDAATCQRIADDAICAMDHLSLV